MEAGPSLGYFNHNDNYDLIHKIGRITPWHSVIGTYLTKSISSSFSLPLAISAEKQIQNPNNQYPAILFSLLIPSFPVVISLFSMATTHEFRKFFFISQIFQIPKYWFTNFIYYPLNKEYQYQGIFYSFFVVWYDLLGPLIIFIFLYPLYFDNMFNDLRKFSEYLKRFFNLPASFFSSILFFLFREGHSTFISSLTFLPLFYQYYIQYSLESFCLIIKYISTPRTKGAIRCLFSLPFFLSILGGIIVCHRIYHAQSFNYSNNALDLSKFINQNFSPCTLR